MKDRVQSAAVIIHLIAGLILGAYLFYRLGALIVLVLIAVVITNGIHPIVCMLQRPSIRGWHMPRTLAALLVMLALVAIFVVFASVLVVTAVNESTTFAQKTWPVLYSRFTFWLDNRVTVSFPIIPKSSQLASHIGAQSGQIASYIWSTTQTIFGLVGGLFSALTVFILTIFFTTFREQIVYTFTLFIPPAYQPRAREIGHKAALKMGGWLRGQLMLAVIIATIVSIVMNLMGVPYAMIIALCGGVGELIPMVGPILAFIPAVLLTLLIPPFSLPQLIMVILFFLVLIAIENYVLGPRIMQHQVELPPITSILALLTGGTLFGIAGALLAIPITAAGRVIMHEAVFPAIQGKSREEIAREVPGKRKNDHPPKDCVS